MVSWYACSLVLNSDSVSSMRLPRLASCESWESDREDGQRCRTQWRTPWEWVQKLGSDLWAHRIGSFTDALRGAGVVADCQGNGVRHVVVGEVLPQQQCLLVLLPRQTVAVVVDVECLAPGNRGVIWTMSAWDEERVVGGDRRGEEKEIEEPPGWARMTNKLRRKSRRKVIECTEKRKSFENVQKQDLCIQI